MVDKSGNNLLVTQHNDGHRHTATEFRVLFVVTSERIVLSRLTTHTHTETIPKLILYIHRQPAHMKS